MAESPETENVLREIKPNEVSAVDVPAIGEPHMVVKGMSNRLDVTKANEPKDDMSREELEAAREARSKEYGIEVLETGSSLTYPSGYPTKLDDYGDPVNLKYPTDTKERAANARVRFKQNADAYQKDSSKKVVHERIVRAELKHGIEPGYDPEDPLDQMLPSDLKDQLTESTTKQGGQMTTKKLDETHVPRSVMKVVHKRLRSSLENVGELSDVAKNLKVAEDGQECAPQFLIDMTKAVAAEIRSLLPDNETPIQKRGTSESVLSLRAITKRAEDIEKSNAVSYLVRDRWVNVSQSVSEYMTTYVDGIEHDDNGPMLIPDGLESTVDKTAGELEGLAEEYTPEGSSQEPESNPDAEMVAKSGTTVRNLQEEGFDIRQAFDMVMKAIAEINPTQTNSPPVVGEPQEERMDEQTTDQEGVVTDELATASDEAAATQEPSTTEPESAPSAEPEEAPATKGTGNDAILAALAAMEKKFDQRFEGIEKSVEDIRGVANASAEQVNKALRKRADSKGGAPDSTTKVTEKKNSKDEGSFAGVLGLPGVD